MCRDASTPCWDVWETMSSSASLVPLAARPETTSWVFSEWEREGEGQGPTEPSWGTAYKILT